MLFRLTENVFVQDDPEVPGRRVGWSSVNAPPAADTAALTHAIRFYQGGGAAQQMQDLTAASVRKAQAHAALPVKLLAVPLEGEAGCVPEGFAPTAPLRRTVADVHKFQVRRVLALVSDILDLAAAQADPNGYLIYTNADICLTTGFYHAVRAYLNMGFDAVIINRRTVGNFDEYGSNPELAASNVGTKHLGFDCFVFPAKWVASFLKTESCVGVGSAMRPLIYNLVVHADRLLIGRAMHLTYHYGDDMPWATAAFNEYLSHNDAQVRYALETLCRHPVQFEKLRQFCEAHGEQYRPKVISPLPASYPEPK